MGAPALFTEDAGSEAEDVFSWGASHRDDFASNVLFNFFSRSYEREHSMNCTTRIAAQLALACCLTTTFVPALPAQDDKETKRSERQSDNDQPVPPAQLRNATIWHAPKSISTQDLFLGQGGEKHQPKPPFTFLKEDHNGTNPKMDVRDAEGKKWRVKTGDEAQPEVVASRLLWAVGYYVNDDYVLPVATVSGVEMKRGDKETKSGALRDARFSRKPGGQDKIGTWEWKTNPFYGTREFNGLRVMMAVMNNWDLKDVNNSVYFDSKTKQHILLVNDIGATFGTNGLTFSQSKSKGNVDSFKDSKFIKNQTSTTVDFATPKRPTGMLVATLGATAKSFSMRSGLDWIGDDIPRADAKWIGGLLGQLTHQQLVDAFRAGNFPSQDIDEYVTVVENRIAELRKL
jgi:hypothetical protein